MIFGGNPDPGILNSEFQLYRVVRVAGTIDTQFDASTLGKLQGVAKDVDQHLTNAKRVADERIRGRFGDGTTELQALGLCQSAHHLECLIYHSTQQETRGIDLQMAGFDLRKIQDFVQNSQQGFRRGLRGLDVAAHLFTIRRKCKGLHADDSVHRCADFVAHVGHKLALCQIGYLGFFPQGRFGFQLAPDNIYFECQFLDEVCLFNRQCGQTTGGFGSLGIKSEREDWAIGKSHQHPKQLANPRIQVTAPTRFERAFAPIAFAQDRLKDRFG